MKYIHWNNSQDWFMCKEIKNDCKRRYGSSVIAKINWLKKGSVAVGSIIGYGLKK